MPSSPQRSDPQQQALHAFDLDHTLLRLNSSYLFLQIAYRQGVFNLRQRFTSLFLMIGYRLRLLSQEQLHEKAFKSLFKGRGMSEFRNTLQELLKRLPTFLSTKVIARLEAAKNAKEQVILLSSSPDFIVGPIASFLKISYWRATHYHLDREERFEALSSICTGEKKRQIVMQYQKEHQIPFARSTAYSDSLDDLPFLQSCGHAVVVQPTGQLRKICLQHHWEILDP